MIRFKRKNNKNGKISNGLDLTTAKSIQDIKKIVEVQQDVNQDPPRWGSSRG